MRQYNLRNNNTFFKTVPFQSVFIETLKSNEPWIITQEPIDQWSIFTGKLLMKNDDQWDNVTLDLHPERLYKRDNYNLDESQYCQLQCCFLKKFSHYDPTLPNYRHGIRLQFGSTLIHLLADSSEQFKKWFSLLRRKYKLVGKLKYNDPIFGQCCYSCVRVQDAEYYITKIIDKGLLVQQQKSNLFREISNLRKLSHTQIVYFVELFEDETHLYLIYEFFSGMDLRTYIKESQLYSMAETSMIGLEEKLLSEVMYGLLQSIHHMHQRGIFHRDIKLDNLIIPEKKRLPFLLVCNFCYSEQWLNEQQIFKKCGTPGFVAPEIFKTKNYTPKVDIFSLGVVFYILVYGRLPFEGKDQEEILKSNEKADVDYKAEKKICKKISQSGIDLLKGMLQKDPNKRHSASSCLSHHWFIKMGTKKTQRNQNYLQPVRGRSLSTIVENSVDITQSFYQTQSNSRGMSLNRRQDEDRVEKEFVSESLYFNKDCSFKIKTQQLVMNINDLLIIILLINNDLDFHTLLNQHKLYIDLLKQNLNARNVLMDDSNLNQMSIILQMLLQMLTKLIINYEFYTFNFETLQVGLPTLFILFIGSIITKLYYEQQTKFSGSKNIVISGYSYGQAGYIVLPAQSNSHPYTYKNSIKRVPKDGQFFVSFQYDQRKLTIININPYELNPPEYVSDKSLQYKNYLRTNANGLSGSYMLIQCFINLTQCKPLCLFSYIEISNLLFKYYLLHFTLTTGVVDYVIHFVSSINLHSLNIKSKFLSKSGKNIPYEFGIFITKSISL